VSFPILFSGCKGLGALFKVLAVAAYVGVRVAAAAATSSHSSSEESHSSSYESTQRSRTVQSSSGPTNTTITDHCLCPYDPHGVMSCAEENVCRLTCDEGWVYREGICVPGERPQNISDYP
jgi:delta-aminolevulinic acid dehydratase/porphobilinogen synthase